MAQACSVGFIIFICFTKNLVNSALSCGEFKELNNRIVALEKTPCGHMNLVLKIFLVKALNH